MKKHYLAGLLAAGVLAVSFAAPAHAATSDYASNSCFPPLRPSIYGASVGTLSLRINNLNHSSTDTWFNVTRTTRVKLTDAGEFYSPGGRATFSGTLTNKGQDCRLL